MLTIILISIFVVGIEGLPNKLLPQKPITTQTPLEYDCDYINNTERIDCKLRSLPVYGVNNITTKIYPEAITKLEYEFMLERRNTTGRIATYVSLFNFGDNFFKYVEISKRVKPKNIGHALFPELNKINDKIILDEMAFGQILDTFASTDKIQNKKFLTYDYPTKLYHSKLIETEITRFHHPFQIAFIQNRKLLNQRTVYLNFEEYEQLVMRSSQLLHDLREIDEN